MSDLHDYRMKDLEDKLKNKVDRLEFKPVQTLVYGLVGSILLAFLGAVIALVIR